LEDLGGNGIGLKNAWMQSAFPHIDYLQCTDSQDCGFKLVEQEVTANSRFVLDIDECAIGADTCDPNADCANTRGSFTCTCRDGFEGDGSTCHLVDACVVDNGGCGQLCVGTEQ